MSRVVIAGGAGFIGSHLADLCLQRGHTVTVLDDLSTGRMDNVPATAAFVQHDAAQTLPRLPRADHVLHLASPASPPDFLARPMACLRAGSYATHNLLNYAQDCGATFLLASTSEVYGDPLQHPQTETYRGNVSPTGTRAVYDEAKRYAEAVTMAYRRAGLRARIARIFNTYGPGMRHDDGRVVPTLLDQARRGVPLTLHGDGSQTRSLCFVDDLIEGLIALLCSSSVGPVNIGSDYELTMAELAGTIIEATGSRSTIEFVPRPEDDPQVRRPQTDLARELLGWQAMVTPREGLFRTVAWYRDQLVA